MLLQSLMRFRHNDHNIDFAAESLDDGSVVMCSRSNGGLEIGDALSNVSMGTPPELFNVCGRFSS